jgi:hypothetical protein
MSFYTAAWLTVPGHESRNWFSSAGDGTLLVGRFPKFWFDLSEGRGA